MLHTCLQFLGLFLALGASVFLLKGNLSIGENEIAELSRTRFDYSPMVVENLANQYADTRVGLVLLLFAFLFQVCSAIAPPEISIAGHGRYGGLVLALILSLIVVGGSWSAARSLAERTADKVTMNLESSSDRGQTTYESLQERER